MSVPYMRRLKGGMQLRSSAFSRFSSPMVLILFALLSIKALGILIKLGSWVSLKLKELPPIGLILIICFFLVVVL